MNYVVFDLEFNQPWDLQEDNKDQYSKCPFEIIQIGAVKLDENLQLVSTFDKLVKPQVYSTLHPFVKQITNISLEALKAAEPFQVIYKEFTEFINTESIFCIWGLSDIKELIRNIHYHKLDSSIIPKAYINVQHNASSYLHCPRGSNIGLGNAVELLNIVQESRFHDAYNDAYYTSEVFKLIYRPDIKPTIYHPYKRSRFNRFHKKTKLDLNSLIKQFEKMYQREMTLEEQSIIKLAYMMGKTNQFQIEITKTENPK